MLMFWRKQCCIDDDSRLVLLPFYDVYDDYNDYNDDILMMMMFWRKQCCDDKDTRLALSPFYDYLFMMNMMTTMMMF